MIVTRTPLSGLLIIEPKVFGDHRGFFLETYQKSRYEQNGLPEMFVQDNCSRSQAGVLRGLHFQIKQPQGKLVYVTRGEVFDVAVDLRLNSPTRGRWFGTILSDQNHKQMYVPPGFAHGFCVISDRADFTYKCTDYYQPADEGGVLWNDPAIGIDWPVGHPILAEKDKAYPLLRDLPAEGGPQVEYEEPISTTGEVKG